MSRIEMIAGITHFNLLSWVGSLRWVNCGPTSAERTTTTGCLRLGPAHAERSGFCCRQTKQGNTESADRPVTNQASRQICTAKLTIYQRLIQRTSPVWKFLHHPDTTKESIDSYALEATEPPDDLFQPERKNAGKLPAIYFWRQ